MGVLAAAVDAAPSRPGRPDTYHLNAWDCSEPLSLHHFSVKECHQEPASQDLVKVGLVQEKPTFKVRGYRCRVSTTVHRFICGLFSYETKSNSAPIPVLSMTVPPPLLPE